LLHLVGSSILLYLTDDARSNKNQIYKIVCFDFPLQLLSETFLILRRTERDMVKNVYWASCEVPVILVRY